MSEPAARIQYPSSFADANPGFGGKKPTMRPWPKSTPHADAPGDSSEPDDDDIDKHELDTLV
ncbi:MAG TPA: hypothetical protein VIY69_08530 [Candidatus Acidoferrales bacterium]